MQYLRLLLIPFSWIYGGIMILRNWAYDAGIFSSRRFGLPVISIGNLAVGGAGKSPMAEYIIRLLQERYRLAVLSRGYGRRTRGFRLVSVTDTASDSGDEPLQFRRKFEKITVAVAEKRVEGIENLQVSHDVIVMDDAYQHRAVSPGLSLLLFDYTRLSEWMLPFPAGNLREPFSGRKRADMLIITKTPELLAEVERQSLIRRMKPSTNQQVFFSYLDYGNLMPLFEGVEVTLAELPPDTSVFLLTGIANPAPLKDKISSYCKAISHHDYPDHHPFSPKNIVKLAEDFGKDTARHKVIITTEKDAQRLAGSSLERYLKGLPVYYLPITARIHEPGTERFEHLIKDYVAKHLQHN